MPFPLTAALYRARASLHLSLNHGAMCLAHLFGFFEMRLVLVLSTPATSTSASMNSSILAALVLLSSSYFYATALNAAWNSGVDVCVFHVTALEL